MLVVASGEVRVLTDEQREAIGRRAESLLLSAAAGSGKTSVLVERFVAAVRDDGVAPGRILAITFTERAAGELRDRVRDRLLELGDRQAARDTEAAFVGTFHGFCARMLRAHSFAAGWTRTSRSLTRGWQEGCASWPSSRRCASCSPPWAPQRSTCWRHMASTGCAR